MKMRPLLLALGAVGFAATAFAAAAPAAPAPATTRELSTAFAQIREALPRVSMRGVDRCFTRGEDARADALGLPKRFCIRRVGTQEPADAVTPFEREGSGVVEGSSVDGALRHISGGSRRKDGGWDLVVDLFQAPAGKEACGTLSTAFAAIYFPVDAVGRPTAGEVSVRGFMMDGAALCRAPAASVELEYKPE